MTPHLSAGYNLIGWQDANPRDKLATSSVAICWPHLYAANDYVTIANQTKKDK